MCDQGWNQSPISDVLPSKSLFPFLNVYIQADWRTKRGVASGLQAQRYAHEVPDTHPGLSDSRLLELAKSQQQVAWSEKQAEAEQWTQAAAAHVPWAYWIFFLIGGFILFLIFIL